MAADWAERAIFWHVYPLGFVGAEARATDDGVAHRLQRLEPWLDYLQELGCNALALGPIFQSESHGYDTLDHFRIDPRLGDERDFDRLVQLLRSRGVRLLLDGVFNHVGRGFPRLQDVLARGDASPSARWFRPSRRHPHELATFEGHHGLVALNHDEPEVAAYVHDVMHHWLSRGADGFRLDAAYAVKPQFWRPLLERLRREHPAAWFVAEVIHGDYAAISEQAGFDAVTQYELWKAIWSSLNDRNFFELAWALERHGQFVERFLPLTFVGNHDVTRIASRLRDLRHLPHALVVLFTLPGAPSIYAGDEQAFRGVKEERAGGDDAIRPEFPLTPGDLLRDGWRIYHLHQALIALRRERPWLQRAPISLETKTNTSIVYRSGQLRVALNLSDQPLALAADGQCVLASSAQPTAASVEPHGWLLTEPTR
ncbi:MAG TPA: alpha-amylase family protein [Polyangiales bacterium]|nr:alpha-amylase family protein [Polyangiales bacterium]